MALSTGNKVTAVDANSISNKITAFRQTAGLAVDSTIPSFSAGTKITPIYIQALGTAINAVADIQSGCTSHCSAYHNTQYASWYATHKSLQYNAQYTPYESTPSSHSSLSAIHIGTETYQNQNASDHHGFSYVTTYGEGTIYPEFAQTTTGTCNPFQYYCTANYIGDNADYYGTYKTTQYTGKNATQDSVHNGSLYSGYNAANYTTFNSSHLEADNATYNYSNLNSYKSSANSSNHSSYKSSYNATYKGTQYGAQKISYKSST